MSANRKCSRNESKLTQKFLLVTPKGVESVDLAAGLTLPVPWTKTRRNQVPAVGIWQEASLSTVLDSEICCELSIGNEAPHAAVPAVGSVWTSELFGTNGTVSHEEAR